MLKLGFKTFFELFYLIGCNEHKLPEDVFFEFEIKHLDVNSFFTAGQQALHCTVMSEENTVEFQALKGGLVYPKTW